MHIIFNHVDLLFDQAVPVGQIVNGDYYLSILKKVRLVHQGQAARLGERWTYLATRQCWCSPQDGGTGDSELL